MHPFRTASWRRAPLLLFQRPVVLFGIVAATGVLAVAASAGVLFASTLGTASLRAQARDACAEASIPRTTRCRRRSTSSGWNAAGVAAMRRVGIPGRAYWVDTTSAMIQSTQVTLFARAGALDHVRLLTPNRGQAGAWFPDGFAAKLHARPGDGVRTPFAARPGRAVAPVLDDRPHRGHPVRLRRRHFPRSPASELPLDHPGLRGYLLAAAQIGYRVI